MDIVPIDVQYYQTISGRIPVKEWLDSLPVGPRQTVEARLARVRRGLLGDIAHVREGVFEIKIDVGPGYRIYFGRRGRAIVILLQAGSKRRQQADIEKAVWAWRECLRRMPR